MTAAVHVTRDDTDAYDYDRRLIVEVHPASWTNPTPKGRYNLVVIGGGTAGLVSAVGAASLGARVALVERHWLGGDCLNYVQNALFFGRKRASALVMPWCTYTDPEVAHVGLYEQEAKDKGGDVTTLTVQLADNDRAVLDGETIGFGRVHVDRKGRLLGATLVARHAGESIGDASVALTAKLTIGALSSAIHPYPTQAEVWKRLGDAYQARRLTPRVRSVFQWLMRRRR